MFAFGKNILFGFIGDSMDFMKMPHNQVFNVHITGIYKLYQLTINNPIIHRVVRH